MHLQSLCQYILFIAHMGHPTICVDTIDDVEIESLTDKHNPKTDTIDKIINKEQENTKKMLHTALEHKFTNNMHILFRH